MAGIVGSNSSQATTVVVPNTASAGDYAYIYTTSSSSNGGGSASTSPGNGWTVWQEQFTANVWQPHTTIFRKVLTAADVGSTVSTANTSNGVIGAAIVVVSGVTAENFVGWNEGWNGQNPPTSPAGTLGANQIALMSGHDQGNYSPWSAPSSAAMVESSSTTPGEFRAVYVAESSTVAGGQWIPNDPSNNSNWGTSTLVLTCEENTSPGDQDLGQFCIGEQITPFQLLPIGGAFNYVSGGTLNLNLSPTGLVTGDIDASNFPGPSFFVFEQGGQNYTASYDLVDCTGGGGDQALGTFCIGEAINPVQLQPVGGTFNYVSGGTANLTLSLGGLLTGTVVAGTTAGPASFIFEQGGQNYEASYNLIDCSGGSDECGFCMVGDSIGAMTQQNTGFPGWTVDALGGRPLATGTPPTGLTILQSKVPNNVNDVLVIELGTNDSFTNANVGNYPSQIQQAITTAQSNGWSKIVWVNTYRDDQFGSPSDTDAFNAALTSVASQYADVTICDWAGFIRNNTSLLQDGTHPTVPAGTTAFRDRVTACAELACDPTVVSDCESMSATWCVGENVSMQLMPAGSNFEIISGNFPAGVLFNSISDILTGSPTTAGSGTFSFRAVGQTGPACTFAWTVESCGRRSVHVII